MAAGRAAEFESLYERHSREVWAVAYARWLDGELALDVAQEAFLRLWKSWDAGERIDNPKAWLLRVARNLAEDTAKSSFRRNGTQPQERLNGILGRELAPLERLERSETFAQLRGLIRELPENDRVLLTLRYAFDCDAQQIADYLGIQASAVHMRLSRARQRLADRLTKHGVNAEP
jgi:RNA polymerase sigma-70 factor, ECF subfamily